MSYILCRSIKTHAAKKNFFEGIWGFFVIVMKDWTIRDSKKPCLDQIFPPSDSWLGVHPSLR